MATKEPTPTPAEALRLVLTYRQGDISLDEVVPVTKRLPPSQDLPEGGPEGELSGFWYELRARNKEVLYRQIMGNPILDTWVEPRQDRESERVGMRRMAAVPELKTFALLVPHSPECDHVVLFSSPLEEPGLGLPAEPRWSIELPSSAASEGA